MTLLQEVELMRRIPLFLQHRTVQAEAAGLYQRTSDLCCRTKSVQTGDMGDAAAYIIIDGEADVIVDTPNGPMWWATVGQHDFVGEIAILLRCPRTATVRARTSLVTLCISKTYFSV